MKTKTILTLLALATGAQAVTTLTATEDNFVSKNAAGVVQDGADGNVLLKHAVQAEPNTRFAYFKFDISTVTTAEGFGAVFTIALGGSSSTSSYVLKAFALNAGTAGFNWSETALNPPDPMIPAGPADPAEGITWNNRPALSATATNYLDLTMVTELSNTVSIPTQTAAGTKYTFDLANWDSFRQTDDTLTIILLASSHTSTGNTLSIASSENGTSARRPTLTIPEPSTAALLLLGGAFLARRKRG